MILHDVEQGTEEWYALRLGIPTASDFGQICTPPDPRTYYDCKKPGCTVKHTSENAALKCGKGYNDGKVDPYTDPNIRRSESFEPYALELLAERIAGQPLENFESEWMKRGKEREADAIFQFELETNIRFDKVGFLTDDDRTYGCSPDGLRMDLEKGLEAKCPSPRVHMRYLVDGVLPQTYIPQVQGSLWVTGFESWYFMSYYPELPTFIIEVKPDPVYQAALDQHVPALLEKINEFDRRINA